MSLSQRTNHCWPGPECEEQDACSLEEPDLAAAWLQQGGVSARPGTAAGPNMQVVLRLSTGSPALRLSFNFQFVDLNEPKPQEKQTNECSLSTLQIVKLFLKK